MALGLPGAKMNQWPHNETTDHRQQNFHPNGQRLHQCHGVFAVTDGQALEQIHKPAEKNSSKAAD